jgi:hypothetical protein
VGGVSSSAIRWAAAAAIRAVLLDTECGRPSERRRDGHHDEQGCCRTPPKRSGVELVDALARGRAEQAHHPRPAACAGHAAAGGENRTENRVHGSPQSCVVVVAVVASVLFPLAVRSGVRTTLDAQEPGRAITSDLPTSRPRTGGHAGRLDPATQAHCDTGDEAPRLLVRKDGRARVTLVRQAERDRLRGVDDGWIPEMPTRSQGSRAGVGRTGLEPVTDGL